MLVRGNCPIYLRPRLDSAVCSLYVRVMPQAALFPLPSVPVSDEELAETLRIAMARAGRLPRTADLFLCGLCADYLVAELHGAGFRVVRHGGSEPGR